jgi:hypothetical protein
LRTLGKVMLDSATSPPTKVAAQHLDGADGAREFGQDHGARLDIGTEDLRLLIAEGRIGKAPTARRQ